MPVFSQLRHCVSAVLPVLGPSLSNTLGLRDVLSDMVLVFSTVTFLLIFDILYYSSPSFFRKRSSEVARPPQLRGAGEATLSPRPAPGRRRREGGARAAPGNRPSASEGLRDGWEAEPARRFARVEPAWDVGKKKKERKRLGSKKRQGKHYQASKRHRKSRVCPPRDGSSVL